MQKRLCPPCHTSKVRFVVYGSLSVALVASLALTAVLYSKLLVYEDTARSTEVVTPFPLGVYPNESMIVENEEVEPYLQEYLADTTTKPLRTSWLDRLTRKLAGFGAYQQLASPTSRILVIWPGDRKEQVIDSFGAILSWTADEKALFESKVTELTGFAEGAYAPGRYVTSVGATPQEVARQVAERFDETVASRYPAELNDVIPLADALVIGSLIEREAYTFIDMRIISGVIWNRLFVDMALQLDASLQYVKGSDPFSAAWWPIVRPEDKFLDSPFNTYQEKGLPPSPIANAAASTILAVLNPRDTECLFYFHDEAGDIYCSADYEAHVEKLRALYGRGS